MEWSEWVGTFQKQLASTHVSGHICSCAKVGRCRRPAEAQCTRSLGLGYKRCAVMPVLGQWTQGPTFRAFIVTSQVAAAGAESAVYDCLVIFPCSSSGISPDSVDCSRNSRSWRSSALAITTDHLNFILSTLTVVIMYTVSQKNKTPNSYP